MSSFVSEFQERGDADVCQRAHFVAQPLQFRIGQLALRSQYSSALIMAEHLVPPVLVCLRSAVRLSYEVNDNKVCYFVNNKLK
jgi:hypothetical protein